MTCKAWLLLSCMAVGAGALTSAAAPLAAQEQGVNGTNVARVEFNQGSVIQQVAPKVWMEHDPAGNPTTLTHPARYVADAQYGGFAIVQSADDPMFAVMKAGQWAYIQIGEGSDAAKLQVSLAGARRALGAFPPSCSGTAKSARAAAAASITYACDDGRMITTSYLGNDTDTPVARLTVDGAVVLLAQTVSGSGARFEGERAGRPVAWPGPCRPCPPWIAARRQTHPDKSAPPLAGIAAIGNHGAWRFFPTSGSARRRNSTA